jgi:hypothetical protein
MDHQPPRKPGDGRVPPHHLAVRHHVRPADVEGAVHLVRQPGAAHQQPEHIADGDRLGPGAHPARGDHHREPFGQMAQHLERSRTRADDHTGPQYGRGHPRRQQYAAHLGPRAQMGREGALGHPGGGQPAEVDDPPDPGGARLLPEDPGRPAVGLLEAAAGPQRVHQVVRDVHALHRRPYGPRVHDIPAGLSHPLRPGVPAQLVGRADQAAHRVPGRQQLGHQSAADVAGRSRDQAARRRGRRSEVVGFCHTGLRGCETP